MSRRDVLLSFAAALGGGGSYPAARSDVGTTVGSPSSIGAFDVYDGQSYTYSETVITGNIILYSGGSLTLTNCEVQGAIVVFPEYDQGSPAVADITSTLVTAGLSFNPLGSGGSLYWGAALDTDFTMTGCYVRHPSAVQPDHVEALAGFGWPRGVRFTDTTFVVTEPYGDGVTGVTNWYGEDTVFTGCFFGWEDSATDSVGGDPAGIYCMYNRPAAAGGAPGGNTVSNCTFQAGTGGIIYPSGDTGNEHAVYTGCVNYATGLPVSLPD